MKYKIQKSNILGAEIQKEEYQIIGAGVSGLIMGFYLKKAGIPFTILEKSNQVGGLIQTHHINGIGLVEQAANGFIWCEEMEEMASAIGLSIQSANTASKARYLIRNNEFRKFPLGIFETLGMVSRAIVPHSKPLNTIEDFGNTFLGAKMTKQILEPAFAGIYGASISQLSFEGVLGSIAEELNHTNSILVAAHRLRKKSKKKKKKLSGTQSFEGGFGTFPQRLGDYLSDHIRLNVEEINLNVPSIITTPAHITSQLLQGEISDELSEIQYTPIITTTLFFDKEKVKRFKEGFGCLIPRNEGKTLLGVLFNSCIFDNRVAHKDILSLTCIFRDNEKKILKQSESEILEQIILPELEDLLGVEGKPLAYKMFKWEKGIPVYSPNLVQKWSKLDQKLKNNLPHIRLLGNYSGQISVRGIAQSVGKSL